MVSFRRQHLRQLHRALPLPHLLGPALVSAA
jgi:hypothetical protein